MKVEAAKYNINFNAGLTKEMRSQIHNCRVPIIEYNLKQQGINADFKDNKVVAWCVMKCCKFINSLNRNYNLSIALPKGVFVKNSSFFECKETVAKINFAQPIYGQNHTIIPEPPAIYFSENIFWRNLDDIPDYNYKEGWWATDFFLEQFLHEFMHVAHIDYLIKELGNAEFYEKLKLIQEPEYLESFSIKYAKLLSQICKFATKNPIEAIACDLTKRAVDSIDKETLIPQSNIFASAPYKKYIFPFLHKESELDKTLRDFWNGNFNL